jgi:DNA-binding response OmpR family regulator
MATVLLIGFPDSRAASLAERLVPSGADVEREDEWPADLEALHTDSVVLASTVDPAALALAVRRVTRAPLLVLTSAAPSDRVAALVCGADVCLPDTESDPVIAAHVTALIRRWQPRVRHQEVATIHVGALTLDPSARRADVGGEVIDLRPREFDLLVALAGSAGRAFRRNELLNLVWGPRFIGGVNTVDVHVSWLRQKLPAEARVRITTLRGVGYRLDEMERPAQPAPEAPAAVQPAVSAR